MKPIHKIILIGRPIAGVSETVNALYDFLTHRHAEIAVDEDTAQMLSPNHSPIIADSETFNHFQLIIVVGGDGSLLNAAHLALPYGLPVLGINRGRLGFLTDIHPNNLQKVGEVLDGQYHIEPRFLLEAEIYNDTSDQIHSKNLALNDVVLLPGDVAHMIAFEIYINQQFVCQQRADGLIIATPTGSTAYALSGGGPILHPHLDAVVLVPMFPHTLSSRPIVVSGNSEIELRISSGNIISPHVSCDGQKRLPLQPGGRVKVKKNPKMLSLVHPLDYIYFKTLREKLKWESQLHNQE